MKRLLLITLAILILTVAFQASTAASAAQGSGQAGISWLSPESLQGPPSAQQFAIAARGLDLTGAWDILLFYNDGAMDREIWYLTQQGSLLTGHTRYRNDDGNVIRSRLTGRVNGSNLTMSLKTGDYTTQFQARISDNGLSKGTKKTAPDGSSFNETMRNIDAGRAAREMALPNRYLNGDWWGHKRVAQTNY